MIIETPLVTNVHEPRPKVGPRPLKVARMLAIAHRLLELFDTQADMAKALRVTQPRVSQLLDLTRLAPDIQEEIAFAEALPGQEWITEHKLRPVVRLVAWELQRERWKEMRRPA